MVPTAFPVPEAHAVGQGPPRLLLAALAGDGASPAALGGLPKISAAPAGLTRILLHASASAKGQHRVTAGPQAHDAVREEAETCLKILEPVAEAAADHSSLSHQLRLSPAAACVPGHGSSLTDDFRFASVSCR